MDRKLRGGMNKTKKVMNSNTRLGEAIVILYIYIYIYMGARGSVVVKALCYKSEDRGFETR
jgi:hypothetical protein